MSIKKLHRSFAGGELTPELLGRVDLQKFQTGLDTCRNFVSLSYGPAANRPGFGYVLETKDSSKRSALIPFTYSTSQAYVLEFGDQYMRIHTQGATLLNAAQNVTGVTQASPAVLTYTGADPTNGQWAYLSGITGMVELNGRYVKIANVNTGANTFELTDLNGNAINSVPYGAYVSGGTFATVFEIATPYLEADLLDLHYTQSADVLTITHPGYQQRELRRLGATNWTLTALSFTPTQTAPTEVRVAATVGSGSTRYRYKVTAIATDGLEESLGSIEATQAPSSFTAFTKANPGVFTTSGAHNLAVDELAYVSSIGGMVEITDGYYKINSVPTGTTGSLKTTAGVVVDTTTYTTYTSGGTIAECGVTNDLTTSGNKNTVTWTNASGAIRYNVYKEQNGVFGYVGQASDGTVGFVDNNITPDMTRTIPETEDPFTSANNYPSAVGYFKGRRWFAGTNNKPQNLWGTKAGTEANMTYSIPVNDDDRIAVRLTARQANTIRHIVPLGDLLLFTSGAEWRITSQNSDAITPTSIDYKTEGYIGANNVQPVVTSRSVIYAQDRGGRVREMLYKWESQGYDTNDISIMAPHLFDAYSITSMAYTRAPYSVAWCVRSDGTLLGCTYVPEHQVIGWHRHDTDGTFEAVAAIPEGAEDVLYAIIKRTIGGATKRFLERLHTRTFAALEDCFFVDAGITYEGAPATVIGGLWHLEGKEVVGLADGAVFSGKTVTDGAITLERAASTVQVGLAYTCDLKTLPLTAEAMQAVGQWNVKNVNAVRMRVRETSHLQAGPSFSELREFAQRTTEPYGSPPALYSGIAEISLDPDWGDDAAVCVRQDKPLPTTVLSMAMEVEIGG